MVNVVLNFCLHHGLKDLYTSRAGSLFFSPWTTPWVCQDKLADLKAKALWEAYGKTSQHFSPNGSTFARMFFLFFPPCFSLTKGRKFSKGMLFWLNAATSVLQNVIVFRSLNHQHPLLPPLPDRNSCTERKKCPFVQTADIFFIIHINSSGTCTAVVPPRPAFRLWMYFYTILLRGF